jgi:hypothetical protein
VENTFCNLSGALGWNLLNITILASAILSWLLDFWKRFSPLCYNHINYCYKSFFLKEMNTIEYLPQSSTMSKKIGPTPTAQSAVLHYYYCEIIFKCPCRYLQTVIPPPFNRRLVKSAAYCTVIPVFIRSLKNLSTGEIWCLVCGQDRM